VQDISTRKGRPHPAPSSIIMASNPGATAPSSMQATQRKALSDFIQFDDETILWSASLMLLKHLQQPQHMAALQVGLCRGDMVS
jgi:hypothetical protein